MHFDAIFYNFSCLYLLHIISNIYNWKLTTSWSSSVYFLDQADCYFARVVGDIFAGNQVRNARHLTRLPDFGISSPWSMARRETEDALLWTPQGYNCIRSDSTLGLWMHRCTVAEQCDLIATTCATSNIPLHARGAYLLLHKKGRQHGPTIRGSSSKIWTWRCARIPLS